MDDTPANHRALISQIGSEVLRTELRVNHQRLHNWRVRGIPYGYRAAIAQLAIQNGTQIPAEFLTPPKPKARAE